MRAQSTAHGQGHGSTHWTPKAEGMLQAVLWAEHLLSSVLIFKCETAYVERMCSSAGCSLSCLSPASDENIQNIFLLTDVPGSNGDVVPVGRRAGTAKKPVVIGAYTGKEIHPLGKCPICGTAFLCSYRDISFVSASLLTEHIHRGHQGPPPCSSSSIPMLHHHGSISIWYLPNRLWGELCLSTKEHTWHLLLCRHHFLPQKHPEVTSSLSSCLPLILSAAAAKEGWMGQGGVSRWQSCFSIHSLPCRAAHGDFMLDFLARSCPRAQSTAARSVRELCPG